MNRETEIAEVIVVEGWRDKQAVDRAVSADVVVTGGSAVSPELLSLLRRVQSRRGIIVLTDPDPDGERIRRRISRCVPGCKHAFLAPEEATDGRDVGVEHALPEAIRRALRAARAERADCSERIPWEAILQAGLAGTPGAAARRAAVAKRLGVGYGNGKSFWKRLNLLGVSPEEFWAAVLDGPDAGGKAEG